MAQFTITGADSGDQLKAQIHDVGRIEGVRPAYRVEGTFEGETDSVELRLEFDGWGSKDGENWTVSGITPFGNRGSVLLEQLERLGFNAFNEISFSGRINVRSRKGELNVSQKRSASTAESYVPADWTVNPDTRTFNNSFQFRELCEFVGKLIRDNPTLIVTGQTDALGGLIMAQLAHEKGLMPPGYAGAQFQGLRLEGTRLTGTLWFEGELLKFTTEPMAGGRTHASQ